VVGGWWSVGVAMIKPSTLYLLFFASGATALIYETAWVRILSVELGSTVDAVTTVLAAFMAGLAIGGYLFGRLIDRGRDPLCVYAALEGALAAYAVLFVLASPHLHQAIAWLTPDDSASRIQWPVTLLFAGAIMLPPTVLMGGTLPVLAKQVVHSSDKLGVRLGSLYGWNTLGAVVGCLAQAFVLTITLGIRGSILLAASVNAMLAVAAVCLVMRGGTNQALAQAPDVEVQSAATDATTQVSTDPFILPVLAFASGCITLAAEVLWTRLFINFLSANALVFATVLGAFLAGLGIGSLAIARWLDRLRRLDVAVSITLIASGLWLALSAVGQGALARWFAAVQHCQKTWTCSQHSSRRSIGIFGRPIVRLRISSGFGSRGK